MTKSNSGSMLQLSLFRRGGARRGAGRKPKGTRAGVPHAERERVTRHEPVFVTTKLCAGLPNLRRERTLAVLRDALARGADRSGFRLVEYSIQSNHLHFLAEVPDRTVLARGVQGLLVRVARALNRAWERTGRVVADRYHARALRTPLEVRCVLVYMLQNARKHGARITGIDAFSSGPWFTGWTDRSPRAPSPLPRALSWLLTDGWRRHGGISTRDEPKGAPLPG